MTKEIVIRPKKVFSLDLSELWQYRELLYIFTWRDIKVRYKQTLLGVGWVLFQPIVTTGIFSIFFGKLAKMPTGEIPYPLFSYAGLVIWLFFSNSLVAASNSLVENSNMLKKVYFPRLLLPFSAILTAVVDFFISLPLLFIICLFFGFFPSPLLLLYFPLLLLIILLTVSGVGMFLSSVNLKYRDVRYILPFFIQIGLFLTPVIYPLSVISDYRKWVLMLNPLSGVIEIWRQLITGNSQIDLNLLFASLIFSIVIFTFGLIYFKKTELFFADIV